MKHFDINALKDRWEAVQKLPNVFAYTLNVQKNKYLYGDFHFYAEYNPERTSLRRPPQTINSLKPEFNDEQFNFNKIQRDELIQTIPFNKIEVAFIINKSPLTKYHTLICPDLNGCHTQRLTLDSINFSVKLLLQLKHDGDEKYFRIGYNSPGALASVNHLHLHLVYIQVDLNIDRAILEHLFGGYVYRLAKSMPTEAVCWLFRKTDTETDLQQKLFHLYDSINWLCETNRPHNLFFTPDNSSSDVIKVFVFARENYCYVKDTQQCNIGFCELAGYVPVGNMELYEDLKESFIIAKIRNEAGDVYRDFYNYIIRYKAENEK